MARFAKGSRALAISDRSGAAFPYREMVQEWTGAWVHISEFEPKQPQLQPHPVGADPQGLQHARPARVEFAVQDILPDNPFTTTGGSPTLSVSFPNNGFNAGTTYVRFSDVKQAVGGVAINTLQLSGALLSGDITSTATTIKLLVPVGTNLPTSGYIVIEKVWTEADLTAGTITNPLLVGTYANEVVQYTGIYTGGIGTDLTGCTRGTNAPYRGVTPANTTAGAHLSGAKVYGCYLATAIGTTVQTGAQPATETQYNSLTVPLVSNAGSTATGGGFQCTIGPVNDRG
jgi:hypothetical protein